LSGKNSCKFSNLIKELTRSKNTNEAGKPKWVEIFSEETNHERALVSPELLS
jgi:hypothetical protein